MLNKTQLPLAIEALGTISWDGERGADISEQIQTRDGLVILRGQDYYFQDSFNNTLLWWKIPSCATKTRWEELPFALELANVFDLRELAILPIMRSPSKELGLFDPRSTFVELIDLGFVEALEHQAERCEALEQAIIANDLSSIDIDFSKPPPSHPRWFFAYGALLVKSGRLAGAKRFFHLAGQLGHPDALDAEWSVHERLSREFRTTHTALYEALEGEDGEEALRIIDSLPRDADRIHKAVAETYACRIAGGSERGIKAASLALSIDSAQSDILAHLISFYIAIGDDTAALEYSQKLIRQYPNHAQGYHDGLHAALLLGRGELAYFFAQGHLLHSKSPESALKSIFAFHEATADWENLETAFNAILPEIRRPMPSTLVSYAEVLTECGKYSRSIEILKEVVANNPELPDAVLALGRALARCGREREAIRHITTILSDESRHDSAESRALYVAFLSELLRRTGNIMSAMALWRWEKRDAALGPRPLAEYIECLSELGERTAALAELPELKRLYPFDPRTIRLAAKLDSL